MSTTAIASTSTPQQVQTVIDRVQRTYRGWGRGTPVVQMRADWDNLFETHDVGASLEVVDAGGVPGLWVTAQGARSDRAVLYFHGGGFQVGSTRSHTELMAAMSRACGCRVLGLDYRLAPEHTFPAPLADARTAWEWLRAAGLAAPCIALAGDSAGGNLVLALLLGLRDDSQQLPAAAALMSAWTDLRASGESYETRAARDPFHQRAMIQAMARNYLGASGDATHALASPLLADVHGLPPLLMQVGDRETVLSDSTAFAEHARRQGVDVQLEVWDQMIHVFQQFPRELAEARAAIARIGAFLQQHLSTST